jgi:flagellar motor switch protein FliN/FliY
LRSTLHHLFDADRVLSTASSLLVSDLSVTVTSNDLLPPPQQWDVLLVDRAQQSFIALRPEPSLAAAALSRILNRPIRLANPTAALDPALQGALAALAVEVARAASRFAIWTAHVAAPQLPEQGLSLDCSVLLDGKRYGLKLWAAAVTEPAQVLPLLSRGQYPSQLIMDVPLVVATAATTAGDLVHLAPGDVWLSRNGWWIDHSLAGQGALCAPHATVGVAVDVWPDRIVLGNGPRALNAPTEQARGSMTHSKDTQQDPLAQTLAELPIEVRVELGSVTLPAVEWAQLQPGDVIPVGPSNNPVRLRANGKVIAEGELVRVDDALGVRVTSVLSARTP